MASLVGWDPFRQMMGVRPDVGRLMARLPALWSESGAFSSAPAVDVYRRGEDLVVHAELPGMTADEIELSLEEDLLTLKGEKHVTESVSEDDYFLRETGYGRFERTLRVPSGTKPEEIRAEFTHGVLEITLPKASTRAPTTHTIEIATRKTEHATEKAA